MSEVYEGSRVGYKISHQIIIVRYLQLEQICSSPEWGSDLYIATCI